jgi:hypothetical protein
MSESETFAILGGFGILVGACVGIVSARRSWDMPIALFCSALIAAILPLSFWFVSVVSQNLKNGAGFISALFSAAFITLVLMLTVPFIAGIPALISTAISFRIMDRCMRSKKKI